MPTPQSLGGQIKGRQARKNSLDRYYSKPNICVYCQKEIHVREHEKVSWVRKKKFCGHSCAASFNNRDVKKSGPCSNCKTTVLFKKLSNRHYKSRKYCDPCSAMAKAKWKLIGSRTKGDVFGSSKNWQSARSMIRNHAVTAYAKNGGKFICSICNYKTHVNICHIRDVSDFPNDALINEINSPKNLTALCPTHHWEFDHDLLELQHCPNLESYSEKIT